MKVAVIGAGASGVFSSIEVKRLLPNAEVVLLEKSSDILAKVRLSGGGRCNLTNTGDLFSSYPRGGAFLRPLFRQFSSYHLMEWFEEHEVPLQTEDNHRVFPASNSSATIVDCLSRECTKYGVPIEKQVHITGLSQADAGIYVEEKNGRARFFDAVILATGSAKEPLEWLRRLGIQIVPQVPSLFTFHCPSSPLLSLSGVSLEVGVEMLGKRLQGPLLLTHWGFSGPVVLHLSSFLARTLSECSYEAILTIDWLPHLSFHEVQQELDRCKKELSSVMMKKCPFSGFPHSLWQALVPCGERRWAELSNSEKERLIQALKKSHFSIKGMAPYKQEFVTAGGISLDEVHPKTLEAKKVPHLFFAGEILDIDGVTGGFNLQAAWTTGYIAAQSVAQSSLRRSSSSLS